MAGRGPDRHRLPRELPRLLFSGRKAWVRVAPWLALAAALGWGAAAWASTGFDDVAPSYWAASYIAALDEEGVVDAFRGWVHRGFGWVPVRAFQPSQPVRRDAWLTWMARLLDLPLLGYSGLFADVGPYHTLASGEPAVLWLEAAGRAGLAPPPRLDPHSSLSRQEAVAGLMRALGLEPYALSLSPEEVNRLLSRFSDGYTVAPGLRPLLAAAARLRVVEGYPDGTLRPAQPMTRAEAAAVLARSALVRPAAQPNPFSPDGDGVEEATGIYLHTLRRRGLGGWQVTVLHPHGAVAWDSGSRPGDPPRSAPALFWDGRDLLGERLPAGTYFLQAQVVDARGQAWRSAPVPVRLQIHSLRAWAEPAAAAPGESVAVWAVTEGPALQVVVRGPGAGPEIALYPQAGEGVVQRWAARISLPAELSEGRIELTVEARFSSALRRQAVAVTVRWPGRLQGGLEPDPVPAGTLLRVWARAEPRPQQVTARFSDGWAAPLVPEDSRDPVPAWSLARRIPPGTRPGPAWVELEAQWPGYRRTLRLPFRVGTSPLEQLLIRLEE